MLGYMQDCQPKWNVLKSKGVVIPSKIHWPTFAMDMQIFHLVYGSAESWRSTGSRGKRSGGRLPNCPVQSQTRTVASKVCVTTYINCKTRFIKLKRSGSRTWGHGLSSRPIRRKDGGRGGLKREVQEKHTPSLILSCILTAPFSFPSKPKTLMKWKVTRTSLTVTNRQKETMWIKYNISSTSSASITDLPSGIFGTECILKRISLWLPKICYTPAETLLPPQGICT